MAGTLGRGVLRTIVSKSTAKYVCRSRAVQSLRVQPSSSTFKAAVLNEFKKPLKITDVKRQQKLKSGEVRVDIHRCGVNAFDILVCNNEHEFKPKLPFIPGFEIAGHVKEVGPKVSGFNSGDRVVGLNLDRHSGYAEECIIPDKDLWILPPTLKFSVGASLTDTYGTALLGLARRGNLQEEDVVLVTGAAGGLGLAVVDIASNVYRAKVIGLCGSETKTNLVREKGAWAALTYDSDLGMKVKEVTEGKGVNMIFDTVGGKVFQNVVKHIAQEGRVVVAGFASKEIPNIATSELLPRSISVMGVSLSNYRKDEFEVYKQVIQDVIDMCDQGMVAPHICCDFDLDKVNEAFEVLQARQALGKLILEINK